MPDALDELARRYGVHDVAAVSRRVANADEAAELMRRLRSDPPNRLGRFTAAISGITDSNDALIFTGGDADMSARVVVRPSGTEPKLKFYVEVHCTLNGVGNNLAVARERARTLREELVSSVRRW